HHVSPFIQSHHPLAFHFFHFCHSRLCNLPDVVFPVKFPANLFYRLTVKFFTPVIFHCFVSPEKKSRGIAEKKDKNNHACRNGVTADDLKQAFHGLSPFSFVCCQTVSQSPGGKKPAGMGRIFFYLLSQMPD